MILFLISLGTCSHRLPIFVCARGFDRSLALHMTKVPEVGGARKEKRVLVPHSPLAMMQSEFHDFCCGKR